MSDVNWRLLIRRRDHTFQPPVPETTAAFGVPNACTTCHDDKTPDWAARRWTLVGRRRAARQEHAGGDDDVPARAPATLRPCRGWRSGRRSHARRGAAGQRRRVHRGPGGFAGARRPAGAEPDVHRAARAAAPSGRPAPAAGAASAGALLGSASDSEPMVRASAVRSLASLEQRDDRILAGVMARVVDEPPVVRVAGRRSAPRARRRDRARAAPARRWPARRTISPRAFARSRESAPQQATLAWLLRPARRHRRRRAGGRGRARRSTRSPPGPMSSAACSPPGPAATTRRWPACAPRRTSNRARRTSTGP